MTQPKPGHDISTPEGTSATDTPTQDVGMPDPATAPINPQLVPDPEDISPPLYGEDVKE